ncbi:MAG: FAD-dependent oxidoreductase [Nitrospirae bacterium]|nr:FAD-dependent oxidoreductase [Nitrospirota bacterium]
MANSKKEIIILGGGLTGLSAGCVLTKAGHDVRVLESDSTVGGLSRTITHGKFRFDLGGHRFFTKNKRIEHFVRALMDGELVSVLRKSKIYMRNKYFDYPLKPVNAMFGMGISTTLKIISDYGAHRVKRLIRKENQVSLEDWVVSNFGRKMFDVYFKEYSEKVWGIECSRISSEWVAQRIKGLSLGVAIKNAFFKFSGKNVPTLADRFLYPSLGIGQIADRLKEIIDRSNQVVTSISVKQINHSDFRVKSITASNCNRTYDIEGSEFISSIPLTTMVRMLHPKPPEDVILAASKLKYRDLVIVTLMINRERVTDQTWIYLPEQRISFSRIHEPKNWSVQMAPEGKTHIVVEYFCSEGDEIWSATDAKLSDSTAKNLEKMGFVKMNEVIDSVVIRVPKAYPLFEVGYEAYYNKVIDYLGRFKNLYIAGRGGMFKYYNMDHAIESGIEVAEKILKADSYQLSAIS